MKHLLFFFTYAFIGWTLETLYAFYVHRRFINRGFLNGPICPMYGVCVCLMILLLTPLKDRILLLFFGAVFITTAIELVTGWLLETIFHTRWWDYSMFAFNFRGYICLPFSLLWGAGATLLLLVVHPFVSRWVDRIPAPVRPWIAGTLAALFLLDAVTSVVSALHLTDLMREMQSLLHRLSEDISSGIKKLPGFQDKPEASEEAGLALQARYNALRERATFWQKRLLSAFPTATTRYFTHALDDLRRHFNLPLKKRVLKIRALLLRRKK